MLSRPRRCHVHSTPSGYFRKLPRLRARAYSLWVDMMTGTARVFPVKTISLDGSDCCLNRRLPCAGAA